MVERAAKQANGSWTCRLITHEDSGHIHKVLGLLVLASTLFRMSRLHDDDMGFRRFPQLTVPTVVLHGLLNLSSFQFHLPDKRIKTGYRIWPEYRLHSLVFLSRSLVAILLNWSEYTFDAVAWPRWAFLVLVLATMAAADWSSQLCGTSHSGFARDLSAPAVVRYFFSAAQCSATACVLTGSMRCGMHFCFIMIIQWNAFFMTLRRKNLASQAMLMTCYGVMMAVGIATVRAEPGTSIIARWATLLRTGPRLSGLRAVQDNKYLLWGVLYAIYVGVLLPYGRAWFGVVDKLSFLLVMVLGFYKHRQEKLEKRSTVQESKEKTT